MLSTATKGQRKGVDLQCNALKSLVHFVVQLHKVDYGCTVFPRISAIALISYRASKTRRLNETRSLFEAHRLFLITYFEGTLDLQHSLIAAHRRGFWALPVSDLRPRQRWPSFALREHFQSSGKVVFLHLTLKNNRSTNVIENLLDELIARGTKDRSTQILQLNSACVQCVRHAHLVGAPAYIWNPVLISYRAVKPSALKQDPAFIQIRRLLEEIHGK